MTSGGRQRRLPQRVERTVTRDLTGETVVYNLDTDTVHLLDTATSAVWRHLDAATTSDELAAMIAGEAGAVDADAVDMALDELASHGLVVAPAARRRRDVPHTRRDALAKMGAAALAGPAILTVLAPTAAAATSGLERVLPDEALEEIDPADLLDPEGVDTLLGDPPVDELQVRTPLAQDGSTCGTDFDCESGYCRDADAGNGVCADESLRPLPAADPPADDPAVVDDPVVVQEEVAPPVVEAPPVEAPVETVAPPEPAPVEESAPAPAAE